MKLLTALFVALLFSGAIVAQAPYQINYQGIARSNTGAALSNQNMGIRLSILEGSTTGNVVYQETRDIRTDKFGMFVVAIGSTGTTTTYSSLPNVSWGNNISKFLKVELSTKNNGSYTDMGTTELISVPFAFSAASAKPVGAAGGSLSGSYPNPGISNNVIGASNIIDSSITGNKLARGVIPTGATGAAGGQLSGTFPNPSIANSVITAVNIVDSSITADKLAPGVIPDVSTLTGDAGGDLSGIFPNPSIAKIKGRVVSDQAPSAGEVLKFNGTQWTPAVDNTGNISLPFVGSQSSAFTLFSIVNQGAGQALSGTNTTQNPNVTGIIGKIGSANPGAFTAGVRGINNGTNANGYGIWGSHAGGGFGIYGTSNTGDGVNGLSTGGNGVYAKSGTGNGIFATSDEGTAAMFDISNVNAFNDALLTQNAGYGNGLTSVANFGHGIMGIANDTYGMGIVGINNAGGEALMGFTISEVGSAVVGRNDGSYAAIRGFNTANNGVGVLALANSWGSDGGTALVAELEGGTGNTAVFKASGANVARIDDTGKGFFNGGTQMGGADVAEYFEVEGNKTAYEAGDVLVISENSDRKVEKSASPYSTLVAGVYATKPGVVLTEKNAEAYAHEDYVPMGVIGVIPTKVSLEGGEIKRGDLLVTSSTPGVAMKADPAKVMVGQVLGKALQPFSGAQFGKINVLVSVK